MSSRLWLLMAVGSLLLPRAAFAPETDVHRADLEAELMAPTMASVTFGEAVELPALVLYYSTNCPHCWHVAGEFTELCQTLEAEGLHCAAVAKGTSPPAEVRRYVESAGFTFPSLTDLSHLYRDSLGLEATPVAHLLDEEGALVAAVEPFYRGASLAVRRSVAAMKGEGDNAVWDTNTYYGSRACAECHAVEYASWRLTDHALATVRLSSVGASDGVCLTCHATGGGRAGGYVDKDSTGHLRGVGCEACHGRGGDHSPDGSVESETTACETCHDPAHTLSLDVEAMTTLIDHRLTAGMTDEAIDQRRMDLVTRALPRPGLDVGEGLTTGSLTCGMCHPDIYDAWEPGHHGPQRANVSCEACHGPGAEHLAGGEGGGAVSGLRSIHDPRCVVEPFCGRCHTAESDPSWDTASRLPVVHGTTGD